MTLRRKARIKAIHIAARSQGLNEEARRALQTEVTGKTSCRDMDLRELGWVLDRLNGRPAHLAVLPSDAEDRARQLGKIQAQLDALELPERYAEGIARKMFNQGLSACTPAQLGRVIAALWYHQRRTKES